MDIFATHTLDRGCIIPTSTIPSFVGALDAIPLNDIVGAYSVARRLRSSYTGALIRVRRELDNAELDIGYNANNELDTVALLAFAGAGTARLVRVYEQAGVGKGALTTSVTSLQPFMVTSGALHTVNSKPYARFQYTSETNASSLRTMVDTGSTTTTQSTTYTVFSLDNGWGASSFPWARFLTTLPYNGAFDYSTAGSYISLLRNNGSFNLNSYTEFVASTNAAVIPSTGGTFVVRSKITNGTNSVCELAVNGTNTTGSLGNRPALINFQHLAISMTTANSSSSGLEGFTGRASEWVWLKTQTGTDAVHTSARTYYGV